MQPVKVTKTAAWLITMQTQMQKQTILCERVQGTRGA